MSIEINNKDNSDIFKRLIELSKQNFPSNFVEQRHYSENVIRKLGIGFCNTSVYTQLLEEFGKERLKEAGLMTDQLHRYAGRVIIPYTEKYFSARSLNREAQHKNLFPLKIAKQPYTIKGTSEVCYAVEGETDAIAMHHMFPDDSIISIGGTTSYKLLESIPKISKQIKTVITAFDNDKAGEECTTKSRAKLKGFKIKRLKWPDEIKDVDEVFFKGLKDKFEVEDVVAEPEKPTRMKPRSYYSYAPDGVFLFNIDSHLENVDRFHTIQPFFYDKSRIYWMWNPKKTMWEMVDEIEMMNAFEQTFGLGGATIPSRVKGDYLEAIKRVGRTNMPETASPDVIQFKDKIFNLTTKQVSNASPALFLCNPIPWEIGETEDTPTMDRLFQQWVGEKYVQSLYEILAYCCYANYPIHLAFILIGSGRNGKTQFLTIINRFLGDSNCASSKLSAIENNRFESSKLFKKLVCIMGETEFSVLNDTSLYKRLTGHDMIDFEFKNKDPFNGFNYAKIIIASNSLPTTNDTSEGFYRRNMIIKFPNEFPEGKDIIDTIPPVEYKNLCKKVLRILPELLERGKVTNSGTIEERKHNYILASNPLPLFIEANCITTPGSYTRYMTLYTEYCKFLQLNKMRRVNHKEFNSALLDEGFTKMNTTHDNERDNWVNGIEIRPINSRPKEEVIAETKPNGETTVVKPIGFMDLFTGELVSYDTIHAIFKDDTDRQIARYKQMGEIFEARSCFYQKY